MKVKKKNLKVLSNFAAEYVKGGTGFSEGRNPPQAMEMQPLWFVRKI
ncbi:hypothetical protein [Pseudoalteromonas luteoviolacea]|uniref:Uncharacterized protein n=1 Tax=Pseudoalteromonas luteoviolacea S4054 TaxID=1129367 RepID=A0A0F6AD91_9GAMM|nr:hypothetical protein [Pseudoalteromonas luteoviolacea]KKE84128.1 hypothetical protein N479_12005 [Pseudoalteromonas luteoviolacea S4054]KZN77522.1 hypothetical protein N481_05545 [Pseudoalteromonas luteoviolacea S4047-1]